MTEGARRLGVPLADYLRELKDAGLSTLPGTAAEILDDEVRAIICPDKVDTDEWLEAHRDGARRRAALEHHDHVRARRIAGARGPPPRAHPGAAGRDGGFTEFVPLPFVHMAAPIYLQGRARQGPTFREVLLVHAVGRIAYRGSIDNVQASWVKVGVRGARQLLRAGCNDLGGTLMDENISRAAGAAHGQELDDDGFRSIVAPLGRPLEQRTTLYGRTRTVGRPLRPTPVEPVPVALSARARRERRAGRRRAARRRRRRQRARRRA